MHTLKVELTLPQCDALEERLLELANDLGKPLNFSLLRMEGKKRALLTGYFKNRTEAAVQLKLLGPLPSKVLHGFLHDRDWQDAIRHHFKPFAYRNIAWAPSWIKKSELKALEETSKPLRLAERSLRKRQGAAQSRKGVYRAILDRRGSSSNAAFCQNSPDKRKVILLDMGMAFGTGNHPTTRLCLRRLVETAPLYTRPSVLDIGCGSGILAITADKLGAGRVTGFDLDEHSVTVARRNVRFNHSKAKLTTGDLYADKLPTSDIVLGNLLGNLIADNARKLWAAVADGGTLILSGLLKEELASSAALFPVPARAYRLGKWGALLLRKPAKKSVKK